MVERPKYSLTRVTERSLFVFKGWVMEKEKLELLVKEKLVESGYELVELSISVNKGDKIVSVVVDRVKPIDMYDIVEISHILNDYFDELDPFEGNYTLDISSLGAEKPLKIDQLDKYLNSYVDVHLINPIDGENIYDGDLVSVNETSITITYKVKTRNKTVDITKSNISKIRLAIKF